MSVSLYWDRDIYMGVADEPLSLNVPRLVRRTLRHARNLSAAYGWPVTREALIRILADLEARYGDDPSLDELRCVIQKNDKDGSLPPLPPPSRNSLRSACCGSAAVSPGRAGDAIPACAAFPTRAAAAGRKQQGC